VSSELQPHTGDIFEPGTLWAENGVGEGVVEPFLRWAGGKRWLARALVPILRERLHGTYFEPFLGSGALFFTLRPERALLSDLNTDLILAFEAVSESPKVLLDELRALSVDAETYYKLREENPVDSLRRAVRFIYLNRTCFGGIYRENKQGKFNTPYGGGSRTTAPLWERSLIERCAWVLARKQMGLEVCDFKRSLELAGPGDVVYCDPAYRAATRVQFDRYGALIFDWEDQVRLSVAARRARERGALVLVSNTYCPEVEELYSGALRLRLEKAKSIGNASKDPNRRKEYLIVLDAEDQMETWRSLGPLET
jgi:DNA adenine methylase